MPAPEPVSQIKFDPKYIYQAKDIAELMEKSEKSKRANIDKGDYFTDRETHIAWGECVKKETLFSEDYLLNKLFNYVKAASQKHKEGETHPFKSFRFAVPLDMEVGANKFSVLGINATDIKDNQANPLLNFFKKNANITFEKFKDTQEFAHLKALYSRIEVNTYDTNEDIIFKNKEAEFENWLKALATEHSLVIDTTIKHYPHPKPKDGPQITNAASGLVAQAIMENFLFNGDGHLTLEENWEETRRKQHAEQYNIGSQTNIQNPDQTLKSEDEKRRQVKSIEEFKKDCKEKYGITLSDERKGIALSWKKDNKELFTETTDAKGNINLNTTSKDTDALKILVERAHSLGWKAITVQTTSDANMAEIQKHCAKYQIQINMKESTTALNAPGGQRRRTL